MKSKMDKILLLLCSVLLTTLSAKDTRPACNTVQLITYAKSDNNLKVLNNKTYPSECEIMSLNNHLVVRCGCYDKVGDAKNHLEELQLKYPDAKLARTYKDRFKTISANSYLSDEKVQTDSISTPSSKNRLEKKKKPKLKPLQDDELRLMVQVFIYKGDVESAYQIALRGYEQNPNSYYWNEQMANICQWTGRTARSMKHLKKMYDLKYDPKIEELLIKYGQENYQYESIEPLLYKRVHKDPNKENVEALINVYKMIGYPEKVIVILDQEYQRSKEPLLITEALRLSLEIGEFDTAKKYVTLLESKKSYSKQDATLLSRYYYVLRDMNSSYQSLTFAEDGDVLKDLNSSEEINYFELKSDLGWYIQESVAAAKASQILIEADKARIVDFERVAIVYPDIDPEIAMEAVRQGFIKYKKTYMFYSYANNAINKKRFIELEKLFENVDEESSPLAQDAMYWFIKAKMFNHFKKHDLEEMALKKALYIDPNNIDIKVSLLWHFMAIKDRKNTKLILLDLEESGDISEGLYLTLASAFFYLHDIDRASYYMNTLAYEQNPIVNTVDYKFLQAYIYQVQTRSDLFQTEIREIYKILKKERKKKPALKKQNLHLTNYLNAAMYVLAPDKFEKALKKAKKYLKQKNYDEISYSWAMKHASYQKSEKIYDKSQTKELWMQFSNAIVAQHHTDIENLLDLYLEELSQGDAVTQLEEDGQIAQAQSLNFRAHMHNSYNQDNYIRQIGLSKKRSDSLDVKVAHYNLEPLAQNYIKLKNSHYLGAGWDLFWGTEIYDNKTTDSFLLPYVPSSTYNVFVGTQKEFGRNFFQTTLKYNKFMKNFLSYNIKGTRKISTDLLLGLDLGINQVALEGTQLYLGGKKDNFIPSVAYQFLNGTTLNARCEFAKYYSQDDLFIGDGKYWNLALNRQIDIGYPDILAGVFYGRGSYNEESGSKGVIDRLQRDRYDVTPDNFYNYGLTLSYGAVNRDLYTRVWRPFFEISPYYTSFTDDYTYIVTGGYGGKVLHQDHMQLGFSYGETVNGVGGRTFEIFLNYKFMYSLSKEF